MAERRTSVLMYSGGMDSMILNTLFRPDVLLYVNIHGRYSDKELRRLPHGDSRLKVLDFPLLGEYERSDLKVPCRNVFFALLASMEGDDLYLGSTAGDRTADKGVSYAKAMDGLFDVVLGKQVWTGGRRVRVLLPLRNWTKTQCVRRYLKAGHPSFRLVNAPSCYDSMGGHCGRCNPCVRKWVAFRNNGLDTSFFRNDPRATLTPDVLEKCLEGRHRGDAEDKETLRACGVRA